MFPTLNKRIWTSKKTVEERVYKIVLNVWYNYTQCLVQYYLTLSTILRNIEYIK